MRLFASRRLLRDRSGMAAIEFALLLPFMLSLLFGTFEGANVLIAYMKLISATETAADLVAQQSCVTTSNIDDYATAAQLEMAPLPSSAMGIAFANVVFNASTGAGSVSWHQEVGANPIGNAVTLASGLAGPGGSVVVVQAQYNYRPIIRWFLPSVFSLTEQAFNQPRNVTVIPLQPQC